MDKLRKLSIYKAAYQALATQLNDGKSALQWMEMEIEAAEAAKWANAGFTPGEAAPLITSGVTLEMATAMDGEGSQDEQAAAWIDRFRENPRLVLGPDAE